MRILNMRVRGDLSLYLTFNDKNVLLGGNKTGKSTFMKLMLYALGTNIDNFIPEIAKEGLCQQVELDLSFKSREKFKVIRKLPVTDTVIVLPLDANNSPVEEELEVFSLDEYSDFLLRKEGYRIQQISFGANKKATLRYYFLLRTVFVDQDTNAGNILASLGGISRDFLNGQNLIKKAIIEEIIQKENYLIQEKRFKIQGLSEQRKSLNSKRNTIQEIIEIELAKNLEIDKDNDKILKKLEVISLEKESLSAKHMESLVNLKNVNDESREIVVTKEQQEVGRLKGEITNLVLEEEDISSAIKNIKKEIIDLKRMIVARQVFTHIPVERCPICLGELSFVHNHEESGTCPYCKKEIEPNNMDNILLYKKMLDESLIEATKLQNDLQNDISELRAKKDKIETNVVAQKLQYIKQFNSTRNPIEEIINSVKIRIEKLSTDEAYLRNLSNLLSYDKKYREDLSLLEVDLKNARKELEELEGLSSKKDTNNILAWQELFSKVLKYIFSDISKASFDADYMPTVDGIGARAISSASLKVATRLSYMLSLFQLKDTEEASINHVDFIFFDSPKDKNLDNDKYERFLELLSSSLSGQVFITGSITEKDSYRGLFDGNDFLPELSESCKLLKSEA